LGAGEGAGSQYRTRFLPAKGKNVCRAPARREPQRPRPSGAPLRVWQRGTVYTFPVWTRGVIYLFDCGVLARKEANVVLVRGDAPPARPRTLRVLRREHAARHHSERRPCDPACRARASAAALLRTRRRHTTVRAGPALPVFGPASGPADAPVASAVSTIASVASSGCSPTTTPCCSSSPCMDPPADSAARRSGRVRAGVSRGHTPAGCPPPPPPSSRTNWTSLVPPSVLTEHVRVSRGGSASRVDRPLRSETE